MKTTINRLGDNYIPITYELHGERPIMVYGEPKYLVKVDGEPTFISPEEYEDLKQRGIL